MTRAVSKPDRGDRLTRYSAVSTRLALLSDRQLAGLLRDAVPAGRGIGGTSATLDVEGVPVFVKQVPLTDLERRPEHVRSTGNLFDLPTFYQYGIGSTGFGAWRELAVQVMTTNWVLGNRYQGFPVLYHWRALPQPPPAPPVDPAERERTVTFWEGSPAVRERLAAIDRASASLVLFIEHIPRTVRSWLDDRATDDAAHALVERELEAGTRFMNRNGLLHFDAHFDNLLTDGRRIYFADFGLATYSRFDLGTAESSFLQRHMSYDRTYTATYLARWLVTTLCGATAAECDELLRAAADGRVDADLPRTAARIIARHGPVAVVMGEFYRRLQTVSRTTPYPVEAVRRIQGYGAATRAAVRRTP